MTLSQNAIALAGEFAVLSQLFLRGFDANVTLGNTKSVDILASHPETGRLVRIEVKTTLGARPEVSRLFGRNMYWVMSKKNEAIADDDLFYCFVAIASETNHFRFYIVPSQEVVRDVCDQHRVCAASAWGSMTGAIH